MSPQRVSNLDITLEDIYIHLKGAVHEQVEFTWTVDRKWQQMTCTMAQDGTAVLSVMEKRCLSLGQ